MTQTTGKIGWNREVHLAQSAEAMRLAREHIYSGSPSESLRDLPWATLRDLPWATLRERNDEVLERIYIGRRFKNDTERLEKLFELYTKMTA